MATYHLGGGGVVEEGQSLEKGTAQGWQVMGGTPAGPQSSQRPPVSQVVWEVTQTGRSLPAQWGLAWLGGLGGWVGTGQPAGGRHSCGEAGLLASAGAPPPPG